MRTNALRSHWRFCENNLKASEVFMCLRMRAVIVIGFVLLLSAGPFAHRAEAQPVRIEGVFPRQLPRGQETVVNVAVQSRDAIQAVEVSPSAGVKVSGIKVGDNFQGAYT